MQMSNDLYFISVILFVYFHYLKKKYNAIINLVRVLILIWHYINIIHITEHWNSDSNGT